MNRQFETSNIASNYAKYRLKYSSEVAEKVMSFYHNQQSGLCASQPELMVDVGCGSGQSTYIFQTYFKKLIGIDVSREQLYQAKLQNRFNNVQFKEGCGENIPLKNNSVDLLVVAAAVHWFDRTKFYEEAKRVLKPSGCIALIGYHNPNLHLLSDPDEELTQQATGLFLDFYLGFAEGNPALINAYNLSLSRYSSIFETLPVAVKQRYDDIHIRYPASISDICGLMKSASSYQSYLEKRIQRMKKKLENITEGSVANLDPLPQLAKGLFYLWNLNENSASTTVAEVDFNLFIIMGKV